MKRPKYGRQSKNLGLSLTLWLFTQLNINAQNNDNEQLTPVASGKYSTTRPGNLFMLITPDSKSSGMGNTAVATDADVTSVFHNNAKLPFVSENISLHAAYTPWMTYIGAEGMFLAAIGGYAKIGKFSAISFSARQLKYSSSTEMIRTAGGATEPVSVNPYETSVDFGISQRITKGLALGVKAKYNISNIQSRDAMNSAGDYKAAKSILGDFSLFYEKNMNYKSYDKLYKNKDYYEFGYNKLFLGLVLSNVGPKIKYTDTTDFFKEVPPTTLNIGVGYKKIINELNQFIFSGEVVKLLVPSIIDSASKKELYQSTVLSSWTKSISGNSLKNSLTINAGCEYWYNNLIAMRAGYTYSFQNNGTMGLTTGFTLRVYFGSLDVSYFVPLNYQTISYHPLSNTFRMGITIYAR